MAMAHVLLWIVSCKDYPVYLFIDFLANFAFQGDLSLSMNGVLAE